MGGRGGRERLPRRRHADDAGGGGPEGAAGAVAVVIRGDGRRGGHDRGEPRHRWTSRSCSGLREAGYTRLSMGAQSFDRSVLAALSGCTSRSRWSPRSGRPARRVRQREPGPDLRRGGGERGVVGANPRGGDRAVARARERVRAHDRAGNGARPPGVARRHRRPPTPTSRPRCSRRRAGWLGDAGYGHYESNWAKRGLRSAGHNLGYWERRP